MVWLWYQANNPEQQKQETQTTTPNKTKLTKV